MISLIVAEAAIFTIFVVAYIFYIGKSFSGPTPKEVLEIPIFNTICLLSSSLTIHWRCSALRSARVERVRICGGSSRLLLGAIFLVGTGREWHHLIFGADDQHESFRHDLLLPGRPARFSRDRRIDWHRARDDFHSLRQSETGAQRARRSLFAVLAFC